MSIQIMTGKAGAEEEEASRTGRKTEVYQLGEEQGGKSTLCHGGRGGQRACFVLPEATIWQQRIKWEMMVDTKSSEPRQPCPSSLQALLGGNHGDPHHVTENRAQEQEEPARWKEIHFNLKTWKGLFQKRRCLLVDGMVRYEEWNPLLSWGFSQIKFSMQENLS